MLSYQFSLTSGLLTFFIVCCASAVIMAGQMSSLKLDHMNGTLLINVDYINTIFYLQKDGPDSAFLKINYAGNPQGKEVKGSAANDTWQEIQKNSSFSAMFLWVGHQGGTLGIPFNSIQSSYYSGPEGEKPAKLRIIYDTDSKVLEGPDADAAWQKLKN